MAQRTGHSQLSIDYFWPEDRLVFTPHFQHLITHCPSIPKWIYQCNRHRLWCQRRMANDPLSCRHRRRYELLMGPKVWMVTRELAGWTTHKHRAAGRTFAEIQEPYISSSDIGWGGDMALKLCKFRYRIMSGYLLYHFLNLTALNIIVIFFCHLKKKRDAIHFSAVSSFVIGTTEWHQIFLVRKVLIWRWPIWYCKN